jgi:hypothetical protein
LDAVLLIFLPQKKLLVGYQKTLAGFEVAQFDLGLLLWRSIEAHDKDFRHG